MHACFENVKCTLIITLKEKQTLIEGYWHKNHVNSSATFTSGLTIVHVRTVHVWFHNTYHLDSRLGGGVGRGGIFFHSPVFHIFEIVLFR